MGEIVSFEKFNTIEYDSLLANDQFLKLTALNALEVLGYDINTNGVLLFQKDYDLKETGILGTDELCLLIMVFDPNKRQDIICHINELKSIYTRNKKYKKKKSKTDKILNALSNLVIIGIILFCIFLLAYSIYEIYELIDIWKWF